jgi:sarcosine oxidase subunit beta
LENRYDVIVIGGGIIGLSVSYYLTEKQKRVLLIEKNEIGAGASSSCDEMILMQSKKPGLLLEMALESLELYKTLSEKLGIDLEFQNRGGMILIEDREQLKFMEDFVKKQKSYGLDVQIIEGNDIYKKQPFASGNIVASTYSPTDSQVNPLKVMKGFLKKGRENGLEIIKGFSMSSIEKKGDKWEIELEDKSRYCSEFIVNAAGAWAPQVAKLIDVEIPIKPKKGQIAVTEQIPSLGETNIWDAGYIVAKLDPNSAGNRDEVLKELGIGLSFARTMDGNYFIGGSREFAGFDTSTDYRCIKTIVSQVLKFFPILKNVNIIRTFAGLRPATPDGKPIIGEAAGRKGFFIAAGHEGDGIALAPITGKIVSGLICGDKPPFNLEELSPDRFQKEGSD